MKPRVRLLALSTRATIGLLMVGAFLVVLGFFDEFLDWDIFPSAVERALQGVFASCVALGAFGLAISVAAGIRDAVAAVERIGGRGETEGETLTGGPRRPVAIWLGAACGLLVATVVGLNLANGRILEQRQRTFKKLAGESVRALQGRWAAEIERFPSRCATCLSPGVSELVRALRAAPFCQSLDLWLPDPGDPAFLWSYAEPAGATGLPGPPVLQRLLVTRDQERAVSQALRGERAWLDQMNGDLNWVWYEPIRGPGGKPVAVVRIFGNPEESYRDYRSVAER